MNSWTMFLNTCLKHDAVRLSKQMDKPHIHCATSYQLIKIKWSFKILVLKLYWLWTLKFRLIVQFACDSAKREANLALPTIFSFPFQIDFNLIHVSKKYGAIVGFDKRVVFIAISVKGHTSVIPPLVERLGDSLQIIIWLFVDFTAKQVFQPFDFVNLRLIFFSFFAFNLQRW